MAIADRVRLAGGLEARERRGPHRLQRSEPDPGIAGAIVAVQQAVFREPDEAVEHVDPELVRRTAHRLRLGEVEAAREDADAVEQPPHRRLEQVVGPGDRILERLLAGRQVARAGAGQRQARGEPVADRGDRQRAHARRGQLDAQRETVEQPADVADGRLVRRRQMEVRAHGTGALEEQPVPVASAAGQWSDREFLLPGDAQRCAARDDDGEAWRRAQEVAHGRRRREHLLEVVEQEQRGALREMVLEAIRGGAQDAVIQAQRASDRRLDQRRVADGRQVDEPAAVGVALADLPGELDREARLARAAWSRERDEPVRREQPLQSLELCGPAHEARDPRRHVARRARACRAAAGSPSAGHRHRAGTGARAWRCPSAMASQIAQRRPVREVVHDKGADRVRQDDLAARPVFAMRAARLTSKPP